MKATLWDEAFAGGGAGPRTFFHRHVRAILCASSAGCLVAGLIVHIAAHGAMDALTGGHAPHQTPLPTILLSAAAVVTGGWFVAPKAWLALRRLRPDMNLLMSIAVLGAMALGEWFEAGAVAFLFSLALVLEGWSVGRARRAIEALLNLTPPMARRREADGAVRELPVEAIDPGTTIIVRPGEKVPLDGVVLSGLSELNQAPITGESEPLDRGPGDPVYAGSINGAGVLEIRTTRPAHDTTLAGILRLVEEAQSRRSPSEQWVDQFARYYTPAMMLLALAVAVAPPLLAGAAWGASFYQALVILVIACPCALVISTPVSVVAGLTAATRMGVLIKGGAYLEAPSRIRAIALDKTGTLTAGHPVVQRVIPLNGHTEAELIARAAGLEAHSGHPLAQAIRGRAQADGVEPAVVADARDLRGRGAEGAIDGRRFWVGSHRYVEDIGAEDSAFHRLALELEDEGHSIIAVGNDRHICGVLSVADAVRPGASEFVAELSALGIRGVAMLTGDNARAAASIARATGVRHVESELLPEDKVRAIEKLRERFGPVAMVGDGVNDAPAMAASDLGIAMGAIGSDAAIETGDIALMSDDLSRIPWLIRHSRRTLRVIRQNIAFALGLKLAFIILAGLGLATLWMAIAADMGASLLVIFNGLRLLRPAG
jgi:Zn2+/Cd2+-exporting ATPase